MMLWGIIWSKNIIIAPIYTINDGFDHVIFRILNVFEIIQVYFVKLIQEYRGWA